MLLNTTTKRANTPFGLGCATAHEIYGLYNAAKFVRASVNQCDVQGRKYKRESCDKGDFASARFPLCPHAFI